MVHPSILAPGRKKAIEMLQFFRAVSALTVSMDLIDCFWREADRLADAQGHGFVIAATRDLERQRQSDRRGTVWQPPRLCVGGDCSCESLVQGDRAAGQRGLRTAVWRQVQ